MQSLSLIDILREGLYDPAIFKIIFLVGGPGSGKSYISDRLGLKSLGYVPINSDIAFEFLMQKHGLDLKMPDAETAQRNIARSTAKNVTQSKQALALDGRLGIIIDGTGAEYEEVAQLKKKFEEIGYDSFMVVVNTELETAKARNRQRTRSVPDQIITNKWNAVQSNIGKFNTLFDNFAVIDNTTDSKEQVDALYKRILRFTKTPPSRPAAKKWIEDQKKQKQSATKDINTQPNNQP